MFKQAIYILLDRDCANSHVQYTAIFHGCKNVNFQTVVHGGGSGLRLNDGFDVKLEIVG